MIILALHTFRTFTLAISEHRGPHRYNHLPLAITGQGSMYQDDPHDAKKLMEFAMEASEKPWDSFGKGKSVKAHLRQTGSQFVRGAFVFLEWLVRTKVVNFSKSRYDKLRI